MMDLSGVSSAPAPSQQQAAAQQQQVNQQVSAQQQHPLTGPIPGLSASLPGRNYISSLSKSNQDGTSFSIQDDQDFPALGKSNDLTFSVLLVSFAYRTSFAYLLDITRAWTVQNKKKPSTFLEIQSKHRLVISSKFPKSFSGAGDLVVFHEFLCYFRFFSVFRKVTKSPAPLQKLA